MFSFVLVWFYRHFNVTALISANIFQNAHILLFSVIPYGRRLKPTLSSLHEFTILFLDYLYVILHSCCSTFHYSYVFVLLLLDSGEG